MVLPKPSFNGNFISCPCTQRPAQRVLRQNEASRLDSFYECLNEDFVGGRGWGLDACVSALRATMNLRAQQRTSKASLKLDRLQ
jgi:hypothetical protein